MKVSGGKTSQLGESISIRRNTIYKNRSRRLEARTEDTYGIEVTSMGLLAKSIKASYELGINDAPPTIKEGIYNLSNNVFLLNGRFY